MGVGSEESGAELDKRYTAAVTEYLVRARERNGIFNSGTRQGVNFNREFIGISDNGADGAEITEVLLVGSLKGGNVAIRADGSIYFYSGTAFNQRPYLENQPFSYDGTDTNRLLATDSPPGQKLILGAVLDRPEGKDRYLNKKSWSVGDYDPGGVNKGKYVEGMEKSLARYAKMEEKPKE